MERWPRPTTSGWWALTCWLRSEGGGESHEIRHKSEGALVDALDATVETAEEAAATVAWRNDLRFGLHLQADLRWYPPNPSGEAHARFAPRDRLLVKVDDLDVARAVAALEAVANAAESIYGDRPVATGDTEVRYAAAGNWRLECSLTRGRSGEHDAETLLLKRVGEGDLDTALNALADIAEEATATTLAEANDIEAHVELQFFPAGEGIAGRPGPRNRMYVRVVAEDLNSAVTALEAAAAMAESAYGEAGTAG